MQDDKYLQELYENIEAELLRNIASRLDVDEIDGGTVEWHTRKLNELGMLHSENIKVLAKYSGKTESEIRSMLKKAGYGNIEESAFKEAYSKGTLPYKPVSLMKSEELKAILNTSITNSVDSFNLVNTTALESANEEYLKIINQVYLETTQGIYDYNTSMRKATTRLAEKGIKGASYMRNDGTKIIRTLESAVRMQIITANNQCMSAMQEQRAKEWGSNLVEVSSHMGARPSHAVWQGKIYMLEGSSDKYPNFYEATGYGKVDGLAGVNCRHTFYPYLEGVSEQSYKHYNLNENKEQYELNQKQRLLERKIRIEKQKIVVAEQTGDKILLEKASIKLKERRQALKDFIEDNNLMRDTSREFKYGFNRSMSQKATSISRSVENKANMMYNLGSTENNVKEYLRDAPIREKISKDYELGKYIESKWNKHDPTSKTYDGMSSQVTVSKQEAVDLIKKYAGTGKLERNLKDGVWKHKEVVVSDKVVGKVLDLDNNWVDTNAFKIHYSKRGVHIVPTLKGSDKK